MIKKIFENSVVTCHELPQMIVKDMTEPEMLNVCLNMLLDVCDKYKTGERLFKVFPYGSRFKNQDRKNLIIFMTRVFTKCTNIWFEYSKVNWKDYINIKPNDWYNNGDGSNDMYHPYDPIDDDIFDILSRVIYVLSDNSDLMKIFKIFTHNSYWDYCEWDEVIEGMYQYFSVLVMKPEVFERYYKHQYVFGRFVRPFLLFESQTTVVQSNNDLWLTTSTIVCIKIYLTILCTKRSEFTILYT